MQSPLLSYNEIKIGEDGEQDWDGEEIFWVLWELDYREVLVSHELLSSASL